MDNDIDHYRQNVPDRLDHSTNKRSSSTSWRQPEDSTRYKDKRRSRSPRYSDSSTRKKREDRKRSISKESGDSDDRFSSKLLKMSTCSKEDSGYGDEVENNPGTSCSDQNSKITKYDRSRQSAKQDCPKHKNSRGSRGKKKKKDQKLPWVPPPLPEHLRPIPKFTRIGYPFLTARSYPYPPLQNQFQNDGSFLEVFRQRMEAAGAVQKPEETSLSSAADLENRSTTANEPFVMKRRLSKPLKTGMVQKPKKRIDPCDPEVKSKDSWSLYMKEVQKYRANKCVNNELACRPLMK